MDIEEFYEADERRRRSDEVELGTDWFDADGARYQLAWVADTGELYVMREPLMAMTEDPFGDVYNTSVPTDQLSVAVIGWVPELEDVEDVLSGWREAMAQANGVGWLAERLRARSVPKTAAGG